MILKLRKLSAREFMEQWRKVYWSIGADGKKNWGYLEDCKRRLVMYWHNHFRTTIKAIVWNNTNPKNWHQFIDFEYENI